MILPDSSPKRFNNKLRVKQGLRYASHRIALKQKQAVGSMVSGLNGLFLTSDWLSDQRSLLLGARKQPCLFACLFVWVSSRLRPNGSCYGTVLHFSTLLTTIKRKNPFDLGAYWSILRLVQWFKTHFF